MRAFFTYLSVFPSHRARPHARKRSFDKCAPKNLDGHGTDALSPSKFNVQMTDDSRITSFPMDNRIFASSFVAEWLGKQLVERITLHNHQP